MGTPITTFCSNIRYAAKKQKYRIGRLESDVGVAEGYISKHADGLRDFGLSTAYRICKKLNMSLDQAISEDLMISEKRRKIEEEIEKLKKQLGDIKIGR